MTSEFYQGMQANVGEDPATFYFLDATIPDKYSEQLKKSKAKPTGASAEVARQAQTPAYQPRIDLNASGIVCRKVYFRR